MHGPRARHRPGRPRVSVEVLAGSAAARKRRVWLGAAAAFLLTAFIRFLPITFSNDHFVYLAPAQQMLSGEWPSRDFVDPGTPLMYAASAAARLAIGPPLVAEAAVVCAAFGLAAAMTLVAAFAASGRLWLAMLVTAAGVLLFPRTYHYPKLLMLAAGVLAMWGYVAAPSARRAALLAACAVAAFLFRHDLGVYVGGAALVTVVMAPAPRRRVAARVAQLVFFGMLFVAPYLVYLDRTTGIAAHVASGAAYSRSEADRTMLGLPRLDLTQPMSDDNARVSLFYAFHSLPIAVLAALAWRARRQGWAASQVDAARIVPLVALAIAVNLALLRDPLQARLPDVTVPASVLAAWLIPRAWHVSVLRVPVRLSLAVIVAVTLLGVNVVGSPMEMLDRAGLLAHPLNPGAMFAGRLADLEGPSTRLLPSRIAMDLAPFVAYVARCTAPHHRLFIAGEAPELYVLAGRRFAGGQPFLRGGFFDTPADQRRLVSRLRRQLVPLALILPDGDVDRLPIVKQQLDVQFRPLAELPVEGRANVLVRASRTITPRGVDAATGLPCFQ